MSNTFNLELNSSKAFEKFEPEIIGWSPVGSIIIRIGNLDRSRSSGAGAVEPGFPTLNCELNSDSMEFKVQPGL